MTLYFSKHNFKRVHPHKQQHGSDETYIDGHQDAVIVQEQGLFLLDMGLALQILQLVRLKSVYTQSAILRHFLL